ncbi:hypothetical protein Q3V30_16145 [Erwinia pyri]|uniref:Uncharacterized protein n=1 Tax=Erwinia pyri TaxID=3062598 RepID=A0AA50DGR3_9GAMM|nr:hypothetical protein [Erwinia sp. DE2]WLS77984.1 hypothetical protein Q3V30_16145 [Erwinia sp. DE2]
MSFPHSLLYTGTLFTHSALVRLALSSLIIMLLTGLTWWAIA